MTWAKILTETSGPKTELKPYHIYKQPLKCLLPEQSLSNINLNVAMIKISTCRQQMFLRRLIILKGVKEKWYFWLAFSITRSHWNWYLGTPEQAVMTDADNAHPEDWQRCGSTDRSNYALLQFEVCFIAFVFFELTLQAVHSRWQHWAMRRSHSPVLLHKVWYNNEPCSKYCVY